jgi:hypothetical protein
VNNTLSPGKTARTRVFVTTAPAVPADSTGIERRLYAALTTLGVRFVPQKSCGWYTVDAWLPGYALALEADGCCWHGACSECGWEDETGYYAAKRKRRDDTLLTRHHMICLHIPGHCLTTDDDALESVRQVLSPYIQFATVNTIDDENAP